VSPGNTDRPVIRPRRSEREVIAYLAFMGILLAFGIDASLPAFDQLREAFGLEPGSNQITLVVTLYFVGMATGQLVYGPLSDRFGRTPTLLGGVGLYCLGAIGSILAPGIGWLFASRLLWGLGAAAPATMRTAVARDLYSGDQMARVISIMMGVFMAGPVLAPVVGEAILQIGSWRWVFGAALGLAFVQVLWTLRFGETLDPAHRRPLEFRPVLAGFRSVFTTPITLRYTLALTFSFGAFISFLGSSQPVIDRIYGRGDSFALWFGLGSVAMTVAFLSVNVFIKRYGAHQVAVFSATASVAASGLLLIASFTANGVPAFGVWFALITLANAFTTLLTPTCYSLALAPMGDRAGTASGVVGFVTTAGGSALAAIVNSAIVATVTPMALGYVVYGLAALVLLRWAARATTIDRVPQPAVA